MGSKQSVSGTAAWSPAGFVPLHLQTLTPGQRARWVLGEMVGRSPAMERLFLQLRYLASHVRVGLIEGEHGTGKRLAVATLGMLAAGNNRPGPRSGLPPAGSPAQSRALSQPSEASVAAARVLPAGLSAGLPASLSGGLSAPVQVVSISADAFLAAAGLAQRFAALHGHMLYLSAVDSLGPAAQAELLRVTTWMQQRSAGASRMHLQVAGAPEAGPRALLAGSCRELRLLVSQGRFRSDLYQQLSSVRLQLPALRDRLEDIPMLAEQFLGPSTSEPGPLRRAVSQEALLDLMQQRWVGNVTQLRAVLEAAALHSAGPVLETRDMALPPRFGVSSGEQQEPDSAAGLADPVLAASGHTSHLRPGSPYFPADPDAATPATTLAHPPGSSARYAPTEVPSATLMAWPQDSSQPAEYDADFKHDPKHDPKHDLHPGLNPGPQYEKTHPTRQHGLQHRHAEQPAGASPLQAGVRRQAPAVATARFTERRNPVEPEFDANLDRAILRHIQGVLARSEGNKLRAARLLGISRSTLYRLLDSRIEAHSHARTPVRPTSSLPIS
jgi:DNA-binding NtrC family response regulator